MQIAIQPQIADKVESVKYVFQRSARLVTAVTEAVEIFAKNLLTLRWSHSGNGATQLQEWMSCMRIEDRGKNFFFRLGIVVNQGDWLTWRHRRWRKKLGGKRSHRSVGLSKVVASPRAFDERWDQMVQRLMDARGDELRFKQCVRIQLIQ